MPKADYTANEPHSLRSTAYIKYYCLIAVFIFSILNALYYSKLLSLSRSSSPLTANSITNLRRVSLRTAITGIDVEGGEIWYVNRNQARRQRSVSNELESGDVQGLAQECGYSCRFRLRHSSKKLKRRVIRLHMVRWRQLPVPVNKSLPILDNNRLRPVIQYLESEDAMHARLSNFVPDCLYSARVTGVVESSIVNLCDHNGGMFGTLVLSSGTFLIEPIDDSYRSSSSSNKAHIVYKSRSHSFHDLSSSNSFNSTSNSSTADNAFISVQNNNTFFISNNSNYDGLLDRDTIDNDVVEFNYTDFYIDESRYNRLRRSANSWDHYVEVLVVADYKMLLYHQNNLENYVLTLFSTVASIYRHPSLKAAINVIVTRIIVLKNEQVGPQITENAQDTLQKFCRWQQMYNDRNDDAPNHHDVAILLTRHDICRAPGKCDTLGLAELGTMCDSFRSCAIIEDNGLSSAFTITHELGHVLNIPHDDERRCSYYMTLDKSNYHIMAPTLEYNTHPWSWSPCSSAMLTRFIDSNRAQTQCMLDQPIERRYYDRMFEDPVPGSVFSADQQCQFVFGPSAELCPYMPACRRLWCATYYGYQMGCRTQHMPWADGTPCGDNQWCYRGECVGMAPEQRPKQDGVWGEWKNWGECSRTCGGGVQNALRDCDNPVPTNGGKYCVGQRGRYRPCNLNDCPWDTIGFRELQCAEFDGQAVTVSGVPANTKWVPKYTGVSENERCKLYCRVSGSAAFYLLKDKTLDGTPCDRYGDDMCIDGTCHKAGCDHRLGSNMKRDICGICGGDGGACHVVSGSYNERGSFGYNEVLKIPAGSANIEITQRGYRNEKDDDNYLALCRANGDFLLNGHYQVSVFRQQISIHDAVLDYSGSDNVVETINGTGPLRVDIYLHVLSVGNLYPPDIYYKFMVPVQSSNVNDQKLLSTYYWRITERWSDCSMLCQGQQHQELVCINAVSGRPTRQIMCNLRKPSVETRACNVDCMIKWRTNQENQCSAECGTGYTMQQSYCIQIYTNGKEAVVPDSHCRDQPRPNNHTSCYVDCSGRKWSYAEWSTCTETCGDNGISQRQMICVDEINRRIDDQNCAPITKEATERECNRVQCPSWVYGPWSECSRSCDGGIRVRHASCHDVADRELNFLMCDAVEKSDRENCNEQVCTEWRFGPWSACTVTCGDGMQVREAFCTDKRGTELEQGGCNLRERIIQKPCRESVCPRWKLSSWSSCSVSCLDGWKTRRVTCVDGNGDEISERLCLSKDGTPPQSHEPCNHGPCPFWRTSVWSRCSVSCGTGLRNRNVECIYRDQIVDGSFCSEMQTTERVEACVLVLCATWHEHAWTQCSVTCGTGIQNRPVQCTRGSSKIIVDDNECDQSTKPKVERRCERDDCKIARNTIRLHEVNTPRIRWVVGTWSECSRTCGTGTQQRLVYCRDTIRTLPEEYCQHLETVESVRTCHIRPCVQWAVGPWNLCPETCGTHVRTERLVFCESIEIVPQNVVEADCDVSTRPENTRLCQLNACAARDSPSNHWLTGEWNECSLSCNSGWRRRLVYCSAHQCDESRKPNEIEHCNTHKCTGQLPAWQVSPWSNCPVTCGGSQQRRAVWCEYQQARRRVADNECIFTDKPVTHQDCAMKRCSHTAANKHQWYADKWSSCSTTCGRGVRNRTVVCINAANQVVPHSYCDTVTRPIESHRCRMAQCIRWRVRQWSMCSVTCGEGVRIRSVECQKGRKTNLSESECSSIPKPSNMSICQLMACPAYHWTATPWSKCPDLCRKTEQHRRVFCVTNLEKKAAPRMCSNYSAPASVRECSTVNCPYHWVPGPWSMCSKTCGTGYKFRRLECRIKKDDRRVKELEASVQSRMCTGLPRPPLSQECAMNPCGAMHHWSVGPWTHCSTSCGVGYRRRRVRCLDRDGNRASRDKCDANNTERPKRRESCFLRNCLPSDCAELKAYHSTSTNAYNTEGDHIVLVAGFRIRVYCHQMNESLPKTYINLNSDSNFAEIYGKRLRYPFTCPHNGHRNDSCLCTNDGSASAGFSRFEKIRVDLHNMKFNTRDFTFTKSELGENVPYATAGDCYSAVDCPQGQFSIDLRNTGLRIVDDLRWIDQGHRTSSQIERSDGNARIIGRCGGYCGQCAPDKFRGLAIEIDPKQNTLSVT